jgi:cation diffusion facilitator family transporter
LLSSVVTYFVVKASVRPADWDHPFGHGKIESLSALFEAFLLLVAGGYIIYEGLARWTGSAPHHVEHIDWGLAVTGASIFLNLFVYFQNRRVARDEESIALETNAFHFLTDVFASIAVFISLLVLRSTQWIFVDALTGFLVAGYVFWIGVVQIKKCVAELSDSTLPDEEMAVVKEVLKSHEKGFLNYHDIRTRKAGAVRYIDLHLTVCSELKVSEAHETCDRIEEDLMKRFKEVHVNIHIEPCGTHDAACATICSFDNLPRGTGAQRHAR